MATRPGRARGPSPPAALTLRGSARSRPRVGRGALPDRLRAVFPRRRPLGPGAVAADGTALARALSSRPEPRGRALPSRILPCVPTGDSAWRPGPCASAGASELRSDSAPLLVSDACGFGDRSPALRAPGGDGATWLSLAPQSSEKRLENEGLLLSLLFCYWQLFYSSLSIYTPHCIVHISPKCLLLAVLGASLAQLTACWDRQGKHWLSPEQRLFGIIVCVCHNVFFLTPDPTLACLVAVPLARVRKWVLHGLPDTRASTKVQNWKRSLGSPGASFGQFVQVLGCSSSRQK